MFEVRNTENCGVIDFFWNIGEWRNRLFLNSSLRELKILKKHIRIGTSGIDVDEENKKTYRLGLKKLGSAKKAYGLNP